MAHTGSCICGDNWRFETTDLATGRIKGVLHPISADWEEKHSTPGQGSLLLATRDVVAEDIWPHDTGLYISQIIDGERVPRWAGIIEAYEASSSGGVSVGLQSIEEYLNHRVLAEDDGRAFVQTLTNKTQTQIAAEVINGTLGTKGIPLSAVAGASVYQRQRTINSWEYKVLGEFIQQLTEVINGVQYYLKHIYNNGYWKTEMHFLDRIGADRGVSLRGDIEGATYGISVDAKDHATWVYALGEGSEDNQLLAIAFDAGNIYPRYVAVPSWPDVSVIETLSSHAQGYIVDHRDPVSTINMTLPGLNPSPENLQLGDIVDVSFGNGICTYDGLCRILSIGWSLQDGNPVTRTLTFQTLVRPTNSIRTIGVNNTPTDGIPASEGAVFNFQSPDINNPTGIAHGEN